MKCKVVAVRDCKFPDKNNAGQMIEGFTLTVLLPEGCVEVFNKEPKQIGQEVELYIGVGSRMKPKVKVR